MADGRREHIGGALEVIRLARESAERASDVGRDRRFLCNDEFLAHAARKAADDKCKCGAGSTAERHPPAFGQLGRRAWVVLKRSSASRRLVAVCWFQSTIRTISFSCSSVSA